MLDNKVLSKIDEIIDYIKDSNTYKRFIFIEEEMNKNKELMNLISNIKIIQKDLVRKENKGINTTELNKEYISLKNELNSYPIYIEYNELLEELDNTYQEIKYIIENYLNNKLN